MHFSIRNLDFAESNESARGKLDHWRDTSVVRQAYLLLDWLCNLPCRFVSNPAIEFYGSVDNKVIGLTGVQCHKVVICTVP